MPMPSVASRWLRSALANARRVISEVVAAPRERRIAKFIVRLHNSVSRRSPSPPFETPATASRVPSIGSGPKHGEEFKRLFRGHRRTV